MLVQLLFSLMYSKNLTVGFQNYNSDVPVIMKEHSGRAVPMCTTILVTRLLERKHCSHVTQVIWHWNCYSTVIVRHCWLLLPTMAVTCKLGHRHGHSCVSTVVYTTDDHWKVQRTSKTANTYNLFLQNVRRFTDMCTTKTATLRPCDPDYVTLLVKSLLKKRRNLRRPGKPRRQMYLIKNSGLIIIV